LTGYENNICSQVEYGRSGVHAVGVVSETQVEINCEKCSFS